MLCKIADLLVEVPAAGDLVPRCQPYAYASENNDTGADIKIRTSVYEDHPKPYPALSDDDWIYLQTGFDFQLSLLRHNGLVLHSSAVTLHDRAYLFSGPCGTGKSTHARMWQKRFGDQVRVINDDKPALRNLDGKWYAYGTPWCGKDGINFNTKVPLGGICFLKQAPENRIRRLERNEAVQRVIWQTMRKFNKAENLNLMLTQVDSLVRSVPIVEFENRPEPEAAQMSYDTMRRAAEEMNL